MTDPGSGAPVRRWYPFSPIPDALSAVRSGEIIMVVDAEDPDAGGDFVMAAEWISPEAITFMGIHGRGMLRVPMTAERLAELRIGDMVAGSAPSDRAPFTVSIDLDDPRSPGVSTQDRARCMRHVADVDARPEDFRRPGHVFPLRVADGGVLQRPDRPEAAVDLVRMAGLSPAGVICQILHDQGTVAPLPVLVAMADRLEMPIVNLTELVRYRQRHEGGIRRLAEAAIPTAHGHFTMIVFQSGGGDEHVAMVAGDPAGADGCLVSLHHECLVGDLFGAQHCGCGARIDAALRQIADAGEGVVLYLRSATHIDPLDMLHPSPSEARDGRASTAVGEDAVVAAQILAELGIRRVRVLNSVAGADLALARHGIEVGFAGWVDAALGILEP